MYDMYVYTWWESAMLFFRDIKPGTFLFFDHVRKIKKKSKIFQWPMTYVVFYAWVLNYEKPRVEKIF